MMTMPIRKLITRADAERAAAVLCVKIEDVTSDSVGAAFRMTVRALHPDRGMGHPDAAERIKEAKDARDLLQRWVRAQPDAMCVLCRGSGHVRRGMGSSHCPRCQTSEGV